MEVFAAAKQDGPSEQPPRPKFIDRPDKTHITQVCNLLIASFITAELPLDFYETLTRAKKSDGAP